MSKDLSDTETWISTIGGVILGTIITGSIWSLEEFSNSPRMVTSVGIWMIICVICIGLIGSILSFLNR